MRTTNSYHSDSSHSHSISRSISQSHSIRDEEDKKEKDEILLKWRNNMMKMDNGNSSGYDTNNNYASSVCSENMGKKRRSGLSAKSVSNFYKKSKQIEVQKRKEKDIMDEQIKNDYNEMGSKLMINIEEVKHLKSQIECLQNLLFEKNVEIDSLREINIEQKKKIQKLETENRDFKAFNDKYKNEFCENKILIQTMKYQLQERYSKYNQALNIMKINNKNKLKQYIATLMIDNDDLEYEITKISDSWRNTSHLMESYNQKKSRKLHKMKKLYDKSLKENQKLTDKLVEHGIIKIRPHIDDGEESDEPDIDDILNNNNDEDESDDNEMNQLWNDIDDDADYNDIDQLSVSS